MLQNHQCSIWSALEASKKMNWIFGKRITTLLVVLLITSLSPLGALPLENFKKYESRAHRLALRQQYERAVFWEQKALQHYAAQANPNFEKVVQAHLNIGRYYRKLGDFKSCFNYYNQALEVGTTQLTATNSTLLEAKNSLGIYYYFQGMCDSAMYYYSQVLNGRIEAHGPQHPSVASIYNNMAICYDRLAEHRQALSYYDKALDIRFNYYGDCHPTVAASYLNLGVCYHNLGDYNGALDFYKRALDIWEETLNEDNLDFYLIYNNMGVCYQHKGDFERAYFYLKKALQTTIAVFGDSHPDVANSFNNLGINFYENGDFNKALGYYQKALQIRSDHFGEIHPLVANTYNNIGNCYLQKGDHKKAYEYGTRSLEIRLQVYGPNHREVADSYNDLGRYYEAVKDYAAAAAHYQKALQINQALLGGTHPDISLSYEHLGDCHFYQLDYDQALDFYEKSLSISEETRGQSHPGTAEILNKMAACYPDDPDKGLRLSDQSLEILNIHPLPDDVLEFTGSPLKALEALKNRTRLLMDQYRKTGEIRWLREANKSSERGMQVIDWARKRYQEPASKQELLNNYYSIYEQGIFIQHLLYQQSENREYIENAFRIAEKSKNILLLESVQKAQAEAFSRIPNYLIAREKDLQIEISYYEQQQFEEEQTGQTLHPTRQYREQIFDLKRSYYQLLDTFRLHYPDYYKLRYGSRFLTIKELQDEVLGYKEALVEFFQGDTDLYVFIITKETSSLSRIKLEGAELLERVSSLRRQIFDYRPASESDPEVLRAFVNSSHELYMTLLAPLESFPMVKKLTIVPDGVLGYLPFEVLVPRLPRQLTSWKDPEFLLHRYPISYSYAASLLDKSNLPSREEHNGQLIAFAPSFGEGAPETGVWFRGKDRLLPLKHNADEVDAIYELLGGALLKGDEATEQHFRELAGNYQIVHLATHAAANDTIGAYSYLAFTPIPDSVENEMLFVKDLYNMELNADLVVLSACETGIGEWQRGEGIVSLGRGFLYAGAKSIITTLWSVDDRSSAQIMKYFYSYLKDGSAKDVALRRAKLDYISHSSPVKAHPLFWAAYIPAGQMEPMPLKRQKNQWQALISGN